MLRMEDCAFIKVISADERVLLINALARASTNPTRKSGVGLSRAWSEGLFLWQICGTTPDHAKARFFIDQIGSQAARLKSLTGTK